MCVKSICFGTNISLFNSLGQTYPTMHGFTNTTIICFMFWNFYSGEHFALKVRENYLSFVAVEIMAM